ncbi:hypothetical protein QF036_004499 [Arthrobacter globiformis]|nr:hypothetical protein [Arthrobacter globiformis]
MAMADPAMTFLRPMRSERAAHERDGDADDDEAAGGDEERLADGEVQLLALEERRHVGEQDVVAGAVHQRDEQGQEHGTAVFSGGEGFLQRVLRQPALFLQLHEVGGVADGLADVPADDAHGDGHQERNAPCERAEAAAVDRCRGEPRGHGEGDQGAGEQGSEGGDLGVGGDDAALAFGGVFGKEGHGAGSLASDGEALNEPEQHQQHGRCDADGRVCGQEPDAGGGDADQQDDEDQQFLASDLVSQDAADDGAEGADEEGHGVAGEHEQQGVVRVAGSQEHERKRSGHEGENAVVVELNKNSDAPGGDDFPGLPRIEAVVLRGTRTR